MTLIKSKEHLEQFLPSLILANKIAIDTETSWVKAGEGRFIIGFSMAWNEPGNNEVESIYVPVKHGSYLEGLSVGNVTDLPSNFFHFCQGKKVIFHNAKFDLHALDTLFDVRFFDDIDDTMLMAHYINENWFIGLAELATRFLGIKKREDLAKVMKMKKEDWENIPPPMMAKYAEEDTKVTLLLHDHLLPMFSEYKTLWEEFDRKFMWMLYEMEKKGIPVDTTFCSSQLNTCAERQARILVELGFDPMKPSQLHPKLFSEPPDGLGLKPASFTSKTERPQVTDEWLSSVNHPITQLVSEYRKLTKVRSTYYGAYLELADESGHIHPTFKQQGTVTGRLSCAYPNLQQIPREGNVKRAFSAEVGHQLWEIDYSAIEYRLAAVYSRDNALIAQMEEGQSIHDIVASRLGIARQQAKTVNFLIIYGGGAAKLAEQLKISVAKAKSILDDYKREFSPLFAAMRAATQAAETNGSIKLWSGRRRHFEYPSEAYKAFNSVVQGGAFEIVKRSMLLLHQAGFDVRNQVHDSVWLMVENEDQVHEAERVMSSWTKEAFGLTFAVEAKRLK